MGTRAAWTEARRERQREIIHQTQPWRLSSGPTSREGKERSSRNWVGSPSKSEFRLSDEELAEIDLSIAQELAWVFSDGPQSFPYPDDDLFDNKLDD